MAGGWARDGAVNEQIEASVNDELARLKARTSLVGESLTHCAECEEPISEARREAIAGVKLCVLSANKSVIRISLPARGLTDAAVRTAS